jgi:hypothetical protein
MLETAQAWAGSIAWGWYGAAAAAGILAAIAFYMGRIQAGVAFVVAAACFMWVGTLVSQRDAARAEAELAKKDAAEADTARASCLTKLDGWVQVAAEQNAAVENLRRESARKLALAAKAAAERASEAEARGRSAGALAALSARPAADGDESCDAADREVVRRMTP